MANTYTKIYLHFVFSPYCHKNIIPVNHKEELQKYTTGVIQKRGHKLLAINFMPDHVHIFVCYRPSQPLPDLLKEIKTSTTNFINEHHWLPIKFHWQEGYGAFSYSYSDIDKVIKYINNQEAHHNKHKFRKEYLDLLNKFEVDYNSEYLFDWIM